MLVLAVSVSLSADRVRLRSGKAIDGIFIGGDSKSVRVLLDNGQVSEVSLGGRRWPSSSRRGSRHRHRPKPARRRNRRVAEAGGVAETGRGGTQDR